MNRILFLPRGASKYKTQILSYRLEAISELKVFSLFVLLLISLCWDIMQLTEFDMTYFLDSDEWITKEMQVMENLALFSKKAILNLLWCSLDISKEQDGKSEQKNSNLSENLSSVSITKSTYACQL